MFSGAGVDVGIDVGAVMQSSSDVEPVLGVNGFSLGHAVQLVAPEDPPLGVGAYVPALQSLHVSPSMRYWPAPHWRQSWRTDPPPLFVNI